MPGRITEQRSLTAYAEAITHGSSSLVVVGEAGAGRTTLWRYGIGACQERGALVLSARRPRTPPETRAASSVHGSSRSEGTGSGTAKAA